MKNIRTDFFLFLSRFCLAAVLMSAGVGKFVDVGGTIHFLSGAGIPFTKIFVIAVIVFELACSICILLGFYTRLISFVLALLTLMSAFTFHLDFGDQPQTFHFMRNVANAAGFFALVACGAGAWSMDGRRR
jgi:putative oxidoreductase